MRSPLHLEHLRHPPLDFGEGRVATTWRHQWDRRVRTNIIDTFDRRNASTFDRCIDRRVRENHVDCFDTWDVDTTDVLMSRNRFGLMSRNRFGRWENCGASVGGRLDVRVVVTVGSEPRW
jgi:hypothetical protein